MMLLLSYLMVETGFRNSFTKMSWYVHSAILSGIGKLSLGKRLPRVTAISVNVYRVCFFFSFYSVRVYRTKTGFHLQLSHTLIYDYTS
jgi:hypothetical protein